MNKRLWLSRALVGLVTGWNLQCAVALIAAPVAYAPGFEVTGVGGAALVRGMGVLFVMWCIPYLVALWQPARHRLALWESLAMQAIGLGGELCILADLPPGHQALRATASRFIAFDAAGLALLILASFVSRPNGRAPIPRSPDP